MAVQGIRRCLSQDSQACTWLSKLEAHWQSATHMKHAMYAWQTCATNQKLGFLLDSMQAEATVRQRSFGNAFNSSFPRMQVGFAPVRYHSIGAACTCRCAREQSSVAWVLRMQLQHGRRPCSRYKKFQPNTIIIKFSKKSL